MGIRVGQVVVHYGTGRQVLGLHGAGVDHREAEAFRAGSGRCLKAAADLSDLPGMSLTVAAERLRSANDVLDTLLGFASEVTRGTPHLLIGHSAGAYYAQAMAARRSAQVAGLALVCPLLPGVRKVPVQLERRRPAMARTGPDIQPGQRDNETRRGCLAGGEDP